MHIDLMQKTTLFEIIHFCISQIYIFSRAKLKDSHNACVSYKNNRANFGTCCKSGMVKLDFAFLITSVVNAFVLPKNTSSMQNGYMP